MKLLVTGGAGFIGSNFIHYWLKKHPVDWIVNFDKLTYAGNLNNLKDIEKDPHYRFVKGDIGDGRAVDQVMKGIDIVVHFAAESHVDRSITGPQIFLQTNVLGTQVILDAAVRHRIKHFHHVSTDEVYGALPDKNQDKFDETWPFRPNSPYAASKAASDCLARAYWRTYGLPVTITNCSNNYGPYQYPEKLIPLFATNLIDDKKVPVYGDGQQVRDWLHVLDHCRAIDLVLKKGQVGETYCVGGLTKDVCNLELTKKILKIMGKNDSMIDHVKDRPGHDRRYSVNWSKIKKQLGWQPEYDFDQGLQETIAWYQHHESWWRPLKS